jgi:protein TonB
MDGLSAAQKLNSNSYDLVLVDCENLPAAKLIFDVCRRGKNGHYPVPIAIVDGRAGLPTAFRLGAELILTKPVAKDQARSTIRTAVSRVRKEIPIIENIPAHTVSTVMLGTVAQEERAPVAAAAAVSAQPSSVPKPLSNFAATDVPAAAASAAISAPGVNATITPVKPTTEMHSAVSDLDASPAAEKLKLQPAPAYPSRLLDSPEPSPSITPTSKSVFEQAATQTVSASGKSAHTVMTGDDSVLAGLETKGLEDSRPKSSTLDRTAAHQPEADTAAPVFSAYQQSHRKKRSPLVAMLVLALAAGGFYAAWVYEPGFRDIVKPQIDRAWTLANMAIAPKSKLPAPAPTPAKPSAQIAPSPVPALASEPPTDPNKKASAVPDSATVPAATAAKAVTSNAATSSAPLSGEDSTIILSSHGAQRRLAHSVPPIYPAAAHLGGAEGTVVLKAVVDEEGKVGGLRLIEGNAALANAAMQAVKQWRYRPYVRDGKALPFQTVVIVDFQRP